MRATALLILVLCLSAFQIAAQATPQAGQTAQDPNASQNPDSDQSPLTPSVPVDPKTGIPLTPDQIREKEIDKYDPLKRDVDPTAQDQYPLTDRKQPEAIANPDKETPLPGSVAESETAAPGRSETSPADSTTDSADGTGDSAYSGPAVLTRSYTLSRPMMPQQIKWQATFGFNYSWDWGETPGIATNANPFVPTTTQSRAVSWGLSGRHIWKRDQIGVSYAGNYSQYSLGGLSGMNNTLNLDYSHVISRRLSVQLVESGQDLSQNYTLGNPVLEPGSSLANINLSTSPNVQLLNSTVHESSSQASLTFHQTSRLSYSLSGSYFIIGRTGIGVVGMTGRQFSGDVNYRWTSKATVGLYYSYTDYMYSHNTAQSDSNGVGAIYSYALNRSTQLRTRAGATRIESLAYETIPLPPALAAILGQYSTVLNAYSLRWSSDISVELVRDFRRSRTAQLSYVRGESPGNGVVLASVQETASAGYTVSLFRRKLPVSLGAVYSTLNSIVQGNLGAYTSETGYFGISRQVTRHMNSTFRVDYRRYTINGSPLLEHDLRISVGLTWAPPEDSLRF